ncbi:hypothetical protein CgunFtcFv8_013896 [Champsocephalus gunnari]|uniref:Uncharacterized protein n=1 Tax=Champsocephalus gunnari TaxID=52237 RepID=A0AAN8HYR7_CHAGU|nr:hypothetical protein CgunFtcFv8_013896 [Champsocephalus gunnari]
MAEQDANQEMGEEKEEPAPAEDQEQPEESGPVNVDTEIMPSAAVSATVVEEKQQVHKALAATEENSGEETLPDKSPEHF